MYSDGLAFFLAGDTSFDLISLLSGTMDAPSFNANKVLETRRRILDYSQTVPLVYLTTHDFNTENRLNQRITIGANVAVAASRTAT